MKASKLCIELIKEIENFVPKVYICPGGYPTIGFGHKIQKNEKFDTITEKEGELLLQNDLSIAEKAIDKLVKVPLSQFQYDALVSFVFNIGQGNFKDSTMLKLLNKGEYKKASSEFKRWIYSGGKILEGLVFRRRVEKIIFLAGTDY